MKRLTVVLAGSLRRARQPDRDTSSVRIVHDAASAPEGTRLDEARETLDAVMDRVVVSGREAEFLKLPGLSAARYAQFSGNSESGRPVPTGRLGEQQGGESGRPLTAYAAGV